MGDDHHNPPSPTPDGPITHIVLFKYKPSIPWPQLEEHFTAFAALKRTALHPTTRRPLIQSMRMGKNRSWEPFARGMTHGFVLEFASQADLDAYLLEEPVHRAFSETAAGLVEDSVVVDIRDGVLFGAPATRPGSGDGPPGSVHHGSCHCGRVAWTVRLERAEHVLCHCRTCQQLGGGPYSCNQIVPEAHLCVTAGTCRTYSYTGASGKQVHCYFCGNCTAHVYHRQDVMPGKVVVRTLLLERGGEMPATAEIFAEGRLSWVKDLEGSLGT